MPNAPPRPCTKHPKVILNYGEKCKYCEAKRKQDEKQKDKTRGTAHQRGYTYKWAKYSKRYRRKHPLCVKCKKNGLIVQSEHVDHITPISGGDDPRFWDTTNHQALCANCHREKTRIEDKKGYGTR